MDAAPLAARLNGLGNCVDCKPSEKWLIYVNEFLASYSLFLDCKLSVHSITVLLWYVAVLFDAILVFPSFLAQDETTLLEYCLSDEYNFRRGVGSHAIVVLVSSLG